VLLHAYSFEIPWLHVPRVIDQYRDVQIGYFVDYSLLVPFDGVLLGIGEIELHSFHLARRSESLDFLGGKLHFLGVSRHNHDIEVPFSQFFAHREAYPIGTACHDCPRTLSIAFGEVLGRSQLSLKSADKAVD